MDLLAVNPLARAFYKDLYDMPGQRPNIARFTFLDERAFEFYPDWNEFAEVTVSILRTEAGRDPHNKELHDLIGELSTRVRNSASVGRARRPPSRHRIQDISPLRRGGADACLRRFGDGRRAGVNAHDLHRRAGIAVRGTDAVTRLVGSQ